MECAVGSSSPTQIFSKGDVGIQCVQSSEFVIGKQTNFNGPVTIINCVEEKGPENNCTREEKIVIKNAVLSPTPLPSFNPTHGSDRFPDVKRRVLKCWNFVLEDRTLLTVCVGLLFVAVAAVIVLFAGTMTTDASSTKNATHAHSFYSKEDWGGKPPRSIVKMKLPIPYVVVSHSVTPRCHILKTCAPLLRNMQSYHFTLNYADISYNFLIDSAGNVYEGRGWDRRNTNGGFVNGRSVDVGLIGDYSNAIIPSEDLLEGLIHLLEVGLETGKISRDYSLVAANSTYSTLSPGKNVYAVIKDWAHFDPDPKAHVKEYGEGS